MHEDKIKQRIIKLLALSTSPNEEEAKSAMNKAIELMQKYSIDENQLNKQNIKTLTIKTKYKIIPSWITVLYDQVSKSAGVYCVYNNMIGFNNEYAEFFLTGRESDVKNVEYIAEYLMHRVYSMSSEFHKTLPKDMDGTEKQKILKSYRIGLSIGIGERMNEMTKQFFKEHNSTALVPVDDNIVKYEEAESEFLKNHKVNTSGRNEQLHIEAANIGRKDSESIQLHQSIDGTKTTEDTILIG